MNIGPIATTSVLALLQRARTVEGVRNVVGKVCALVLYCCGAYLPGTCRMHVSTCRYAGTYSMQERSHVWTQRWQLGPCEGVVGACDGGGIWEGQTCVVSKGSGGLEGWCHGLGSGGLGEDTEACGE